MKGIAQILAALVMAASWGVRAQAQGVVDPPLPLKVRLLDGRALKGTVDAWDFSGVDGSFGHVAWSEFRPADANRCCRKLLDWRRGESYLALARMLFGLEGGDALAEAALRDALKRDRSLADQASALRLHAAAARREAQEQQRISRETKFQSHAVGADAASAGDAATRAKPWSAATDAQRAAALAEMKADVERWLRPWTDEYTQVEGAFWVVYADLPADAARELAGRMDAMYRTVAAMFALPEGLNLFHGKAVVIVSATEERTRDIEKAAFGAAPPEGAIGLCHMVGPKVFVTAWRGDDPNRFLSSLVHEAAHGIMHRYGSPVRLPIWADEGFAECVAAGSFAESTTRADRAPPGLAWIRAEGNDVLTVLRMNEQDGSWPGPRAIGYAVGYLTVDFLLHTRGDAFGAWVKDVKAGVPWEAALRRRFDWTPEQLAAAVKARYLERD